MIVIVGGGLMGLSAALHARRGDPGTRVTLLARLALGRDPLARLWSGLRFRLS
jgi:glycine/D-amino acid oxidase-like deaminating enzyme